MVLPTNCTVTYKITAAPPVDPANLAIAVNTVTLDGDPILELGLATGVTDTTTGPVGRIVTRTLVYALSPAYFDSFPTLDVSAFVKLWTSRLSAELNTMVDTAAPLLS